jgi:hypothetical protein
MKQFLPFTAIVWLMVLICTLNCKAQNTVSYHYDDAGNRIDRVIVLDVSFAATTEASESRTKKKKVSYEEELGQFKVIIYPNPTQGELKVEIQTTEEREQATFMVYDLSGSLLINKTSSRDITKLDLSPYPLGTYILRVSTGTYRSEWKIVKQ